MSGCGSFSGLRYETLENSPRQYEWFSIKQEGRDLHVFAAYPESKDKVKTVIMIHENRGLTDWVRSAADQLAAKGYLILAPEHLFGFSVDYRRTSDVESSDDARTALYQLSVERV